MPHIEKTLGASNVPNTLYLPVSSAIDNNGWFSVKQSDGNNIDMSFDGGFYQEHAEFVAHAINQHQKLVDALHQIKKVLAANPNLSQEELFTCCANGFELAHNAIHEAENLQAEDVNYTNDELSEHHEGLGG